MREVHTASIAKSSSSCVVVLAKLNRTVPHSPSSGVPIASITFDSLSAPLEQAEPIEAFALPQSPKLYCKQKQGGFWLNNAVSQLL